MSENEESEQESFKAPYIPYELRAGYIPNKTIYEHALPGVDDSKVIPVDEAFYSALDLKMRTLFLATADKPLKVSKKLLEFWNKLAGTSNPDKTKQILSDLETFLVGIESNVKLAFEKFALINQEIEILKQRADLVDKPKSKQRKSKTKDSAMDKLKRKIKEKNERR